MPNAKTKILVVDDDLRLRDLLDRYLAEQGFVVKTASDAAAMDKLLAFRLPAPARGEKHRAHHHAYRQG